jgi:glycerol-3-phosphate acyltransferase PlsY
MYFILLFIAAYLVGSVNVSIGLFRILGKEDPRARFSGNPGATNVYRLAGLGWAVCVLFLDMGKAIAIAAVALSMLPSYLAAWVGLGLILGNRFPCFHHFRGGKGVAAYLGFAAVFSPVLAGIGMLLWIAAYGVTRHPFIGSFAMVLMLAIGVITRCGNSATAVAGTIATIGLIYYSHKKNIMELIAKKGR